MSIDYSLGLDTTKRLNDPAFNWLTIESWWSAGPTPGFVGRYFGSNSGWIPGELASLPAAVDTTLKFIVPFTFGPNSMTNRSDGQKFGLQACLALEAALQYTDGSGNRELVIPASSGPSGGQVIVYLDCEPFAVSLGPDFWVGYSEAVIGFTCRYADTLGNSILGNPFRPGLYCKFDQNGLDGTVAPGLATLYGIFCSAFATPMLGYVWPATQTQSLAVDDLAEAWVTKFTTAYQWLGSNGTAMAVTPLLIWQYQLNLYFQAGANSPYPQDSQGNVPPNIVTGSPIGIDLDIISPTQAVNGSNPLTNPNGLNATDFMLVRGSFSS